MREIKFRAWDKEDKRYLTPIDTCSMVLRFLSGRVTDGAVNCPHIELQQYTGLKDKNGIEIYEGDIVDFGVTTNIKEVVFDGDSASFRVYEYLYEQGSSLAEKWFLDDCDGIEVIGNIYEHEFLLKNN